MRALVIGILSIISFVVMYYVGSAMGGAFRARSSGSVDVARDATVVAGALRTPAPGFGAAPGVLRSGSGPAPTNEPPSFSSVSRVLAGTPAPTARPASGARDWWQVTCWAG